MNRQRSKPMKEAPDPWVLDALFMLWLLLIAGLFVFAAVAVTVTIL